MKRFLILASVIFCISIPVKAVEFYAPEAPASAWKYMPDETENFAEGVWYIIRSALENVRPSIFEAMSMCISLIGISLLTGVFQEFTVSANKPIAMAGAVSAGVLLLQPVRSMISLGTETVQQISQYAKLLLPVMTGALAAQGAPNQSAVLYSATVLFDTALSLAISNLLIPMLYIYLCVAFICAITRQPLLQQIRDFLKWLMTWALKVILYVFTGYISITGVICGATDASLIKATKLTISGMVPVVGGILADASEAVVVSAGMMKNAAGIYGLFAVLALWIGPFLRIAVQYLLLKLTTGIGTMFAPKSVVEVMKGFGTAMGLVLAMTGAVCMMVLISTVCFMRGVTM